MGFIDETQIEETTIIFLIGYCSWWILAIWLFVYVGVFLMFVSYVYYVCLLCKNKVYIIFVQRQIITLMGPNIGETVLSYLLGKYILESKQKYSRNYFKKSTQFWTMILVALSKFKTRIVLLLSFLVQHCFVDQNVKKCMDKITALFKTESTK